MHPLVEANVVTYRVPAKENVWLAFKAGILRTISFGRKHLTTIELRNVPAGETQAVEVVLVSVFLNMQMEVINVNVVRATEVCDVVFSNNKDSAMVIRKGIKYKK